MEVRVASCAHTALGSSYSLFLCFLDGSRGRAVLLIYVELCIDSYESYIIAGWSKHVLYLLYVVFLFVALVILILLLVDWNWVQGLGLFRY